MASYAFTTSPAEERAVTLAVAKINAAITDGSAQVTNGQFLRTRIDHQLAALVEAMRSARREDLEQKYEDAPAATKAAVNTALGYTE